MLTNIVYSVWLDTLYEMLDNLSVRLKNMSRILDISVELPEKMSIHFLNPKLFTRQPLCIAWLHVCKAWHFDNISGALDIGIETLYLFLSHYPKPNIFIGQPYLDLWTTCLYFSTKCSSVLDSLSRLLDILLSNIGQLVWT